MSHPDQAQEIVLVDHDDLEYVHLVAAAHGVEVQPSPGRGFEPVSTTAVIIMGGVALVAVVSRILEQKRGGQVVDARLGAERRVYRDPDVQYGLLVIFAVDGQITVEVRQPADMLNDVLRTITAVLADGGVPVPTDEITALVQRAHGDQVTVSPTAGITPGPTPAGSD